MTGLAAMTGGATAQASTGTASTQMAVAKAAATAQASQPSGHWGVAHPVDLSALHPGNGPSGIDALSCATPGNCSAGGHYTDSAQDRQAFVVTEKGGTYGLEEVQVAAPTAGGLLTEALRSWQQLRGQAGMAIALAGLGEVAARGGQPQRAGQLLGAGQALLPDTHPLSRVSVPYDLSARLAAARARGDPAAFDRGLAEGKGWPIDRAIAVGLASAA